METVQITGSAPDQEMGSERHSSAEPSGWNLPRRESVHRIKEKLHRLAVENGFPEFPIMRILRKNNKEFHFIGDPLVEDPRLNSSNATTAARTRLENKLDKGKIILVKGPRPPTQCSVDPDSPDPTQGAEQIVSRSKKRQHVTDSESEDFEQSRERAPSIDMEGSMPDRAPTIKIGESESDREPDHSNRGPDHSNLGEMLQTAVLMAQEKDKQIAALNARLEEDKRENLEAAIKELQNKLQAEKKKAQALHKKNQEMGSNLQAAEQKNQEMSINLQAAEKKIHELSVKLQIAELREKTATQEAQQWKSIANQS